MRIAIPTTHNKVCPHFGKCEEFTIIEEEKKEIIKNTSSHMGGSGVPPDLIKEHKVDILICNSLGPKAVDLCKAYNIKVFLGNADTPEELYKLFKENKLEEATKENVCQDHH